MADERMGLRGAARGSLLPPGDVSGQWGALGWVMRELGARWVTAAECGREGDDRRDDHDCCPGLVCVEERRRELRRRERRC
ncbi:MAG: hypothetical protein M3Q10_20145, partial [Chloroflexota bacterium]|nr:hypothetical protein [Chloroflexota bacterium]